MGNPEGAENGIQYPGSIPQHVAIIMDGNGRWATQRGTSRIEGHRAGAKNVRMVVEQSRKAGVKFLTLYAFSTENWSRPHEEVLALMKLFRRYLRSELKELLQNGIRLRAMGDLARLPDYVREALLEAEQQSANQSEMQLILAVSYGGRDEIVRATRLLAEQVEQGKLKPADIDQQLFRSQLFLPDVPDPDLIIRTSKEIRVSNFLIWQLAYSELLFSDYYWPDFTSEEYQRCLAEYSSRKRRFGLTAEQLEAGSQQVFVSH